MSKISALIKKDKQEKRVECVSAVGNNIASRRLMKGGGHSSHCGTAY
jgi:hypothetical protein